MFRKISFDGFRLDDKKDREFLQRLNAPETRKDAMQQLLRRFGGYGQERETTSDAERVSAMIQPATAEC